MTYLRYFIDSVEIPNTISNTKITGTAAILNTNNSFSQNQTFSGGIKTNGSFTLAPITEISTSNLTVALSDRVIYRSSGSSTITVTLPHFNSGQFIIIVNRASASITLAVASGTPSGTIDGSTTKTIASNASLRVQCKSAGNWQSI